MCVHKAALTPSSALGGKLPGRIPIIRSRQAADGEKKASKEPKPAHGLEGEKKKKKEMKASGWDR